MASRASQLAVDVDLGFADTYRLGRWAPVGVTLQSRVRDFVADVEIVVQAGDDLREGAYNIVHRQQVDLPRGSRKRLEFTVRIEGFARPMVLRVRSGSQVLIERSVELRERHTERPLLLVLGRDLDLDYLTQGREGAVRVAYPHPDRLPARWQAYDGVHSVVVHGVSLERLSKAQFQALRDWIATGGVLAVSGGPDFALLQTPRLAGLLPAQPSGLVRVEDPGSLGAALGAPASRPLPAARAFDINELRVAPGPSRPTVGRRWSGFPLVVERALGTGRILYLAFDVARTPFADWSGMPSLWMDLLGLNSLGPRPGGRSVRAQSDGRFMTSGLRAQEAESAVIPDSPARSDAVDLVTALVRALGPVYPSHLMVLAFLGLYLGLLATGYRLPASSRSGRILRGSMTYGSPLLFAPLAWYLFGPVLFPVGSSLVAVSVVEPLVHSRRARLRQDLGLFSTAQAPLAVRFQGLEPAVVPRVGSRDPGRTTRAANQSASPDWLLMNGARPSAGPSMDTSWAPAYQLHVLSAAGLIDFEWQAELDLSPRIPRISVHSRSGIAWSSAWLAHNGLLFALGPIPSGTPRQLELGQALSPFSKSALISAIARQAGTHSERAWRKVLERKLDLGGGDFPVGRRSYVIAVADEAPGIVRDPGAARVEGLAMVMAPVAVHGIAPVKDEDSNLAE